MNDTISPPPAAAPTFSPEAVASMRDSWIGQGLDPAAFDLAAGLTPPADPTAPPAAAGETGAGPSEGAPLVQVSPWTDPQVQAMAQDLLRAGVSQERIAEALAADGITADFTPDERTEEQQTYDRLYPPVSAASYRPNYYGHLPADTPAGTLTELNAVATDWAASLQLTPEIGASVIEQSLDIGAAYSRASEPERDAWKVDQRQLFERLSGGPDAAKARLETVREMLASAPKSKAFTDGLYANGSLHSAHVVNLLACEAERLKLRG